MSDDLLVKYLLGEADEVEAKQVTAWIAERPEHARYFEDFRLIWDESRKLSAKSDVDVDAAWERFQGMVAKEQKGKRISLGRPMMRIAAGLALLVSGGMLYFLLNTRENLVALQSGDATKIVRLADGTVVTLNRASELKYPETFEGKERRVVLEGEAFFEVAPDRAHPFTIEANEAQVKVVGTSFNVKSKDTATEVIVATGIVEVRRKQEAIQLLPNEATTVFKGRMGLEKRKTDDQLYNYYRTKEFVCNNTPLYRLTDILAEAYGVQIEITDPALRQVPLTVTFRNESLPEVLLVISETLNVRAEQIGNRVVISPR